MNRNKTKKASRLIGAGLTLLAILGVCYLIAFPMRGVYNSDYADTLTWAKASVDAKALFSHDFTYACLLPFGGQLLMMPFVALFGYSYTAQACGMIVFFLLFALALGCLFKALGANPFWTGASLFCVVGALCSSEKLREVYFGHVLYYSLGGLFLIVGLALVLTLDKDKGQKIPWRLISLCAWCVLCSTDGLTSFSLFALPLCTALAFERLCDKSVKFFSAENFDRALPLFYVVVASLLGMGLGALLRHGFEAPYQEAFSTLSSETEWGNNLALFLPSFLCMFTGSVDMYEPFTTFAGMSAAIRLLFGLFVLVAPLIAVGFWKKLSRGEKLLLVSHFTVSATMLFAFVFGLLSNAPWRLTPMLFTALLVTVCLIRRVATVPFFKRFALLALVFCVLIAGLGLFDVARMKPNQKPVGSAADLADYLEKHGYTYGYATFWNANAITVLSDERVICRCADMDENSGFLSPGDYQSERSWFNGRAGDEKFFLALTNGEYTSVDQNQIGQNFGVEHYNGYVIIQLTKDLFPLY